MEDAGLAAFGVRHTFFFCRSESAAIVRMFDWCFCIFVMVIDSFRGCGIPRVTDMSAKQRLHGSVGHCRERLYAYWHAPLDLLL